MRSLSYTDVTYTPSQYEVDVLHTFELMLLEGLYLNLIVGRQVAAPKLQLPGEVAAPSG